MNLEIIQDKKNPLLKRRELDLLIYYESSTPRRDDLRRALSEKYGVEIERIVVEKMESLFGARKMRAHVHIYDATEHAKRFERKHILNRHGLIAEVKRAG